MKSIPTVSKYMTVVPHTIGADQSVLKAEQMMRDLNVRHLPVLWEGKLVGIVSDRDVKLYKGLVDKNELETSKVEHIYQVEAYTISPDSPLDEVVANMAEKKLGSALVVDNKKLVGIFTAVDALSAFAELLHSRLKA
jgi:acetoin utilization protein AcuB